MAAKQLYVALNEAMYPTITCDSAWTEKRKITEAEALEHVTPAALKRVLEEGHEVVFTESDQSFPQL